MPAEIYWRRRLLLLAVVILLVWGGIQLLGGGDGKPAANTPVVATTTTPSVAPTAPAASGPVEVSLVSASTACDPEKIRITPTVTPGQLTRGAVTIGLVVSSTAPKACTLTPDDADLVAVISANKTPIWDSTVCKASLLTDPVAVSPKWASLVTTTWTGRGSGSTCSTKEGYTTPGTYSIQVGTLGGEPGKVDFTLDRRPTPKPTAKPSAGTSLPTPKPPKTTTKPND